MWIIRLDFVMKLLPHSWQDGLEIIAAALKTTSQTALWNVAAFSFALCCWGRFITQITIHLFIHSTRTDPLKAFCELGFLHRGWVWVSAGGRKHSNNHNALGFFATFHHHMIAMNLDIRPDGGSHGQLIDNQATTGTRLPLKSDSKL